MPNRATTYADILPLLPALTRITAASYEAVDRLLLESPDHPTADRRHLVAIEAHVARWEDAIQLLGGLSIGLWDVEFPASGGAWCWSWDDPELLRYRPRGESLAAVH
jgi:hypothetical protein